MESSSSSSASPRHSDGSATSEIEAQTQADVVIEGWIVVFSVDSLGNVQ